MGIKFLESLFCKKIRLVQMLQEFFQVKKTYIFKSYQLSLRNKNKILIITFTYDDNRFNSVLFIQFNYNLFA